MKWTVLCSGALLAACGEQPALGPLVPKGEWETFESRSFDLHVRPGDSLGCESFVAELERFASAMRAAFPSSRVGSERVEIYQFASVADFEASGACAPRPGLEGCAHETVTFTTPEATEHELAHALFRPAGLPPPLFGEGAAVAVSCRANPELMLAFAARDWRSYLADDNRTGWASRWATYLIDEYGPEAFLELYGALPYSATAERVEREFRRVYAEDIDDVWSRMLTASTSRSCMALQACNGEALSEKPAALGSRSSSVRAGARST